MVGHGSRKGSMARPINPIGGFISWLVTNKLVGRGARDARSSSSPRSHWRASQSDACTPAAPLSRSCSERELQQKEQAARWPRNRRQQTAPSPKKAAAECAAAHRRKLPAGLLASLLRRRRKFHPAIERYLEDTAKDVITDLEIPDALQWSTSAVPTSNQFQTRFCGGSWTFHPYRRSVL